MTATRFLALVLAFFLGFLSCIGAIVGVGYYAYSRVSLDKLEQWGVVSVNEENYIDEDAEVDLTAMTVKAFVAEIKRLQTLSEPITLNLLQEQWGLKLPDNVKNVIPAGVWNVPLKEVFSSNGLTQILENTDVGYLFQFLSLSDSLRESLEGKSLNDLKDYESLLSNVKLGSLMGYTAVKDNPDDPSEITGWYKNEPGDLDKASEAIAKISLSDVTGGNFNIDTVLAGIYVGDLLKYKKGAVIPNSDPLDETVRYEWNKKDGTTGEYTVAVTPIERKLSNYLVSDLINGRVTSSDLTNGPLHELLNLHAVEVPLYEESGDPLLYTTGDHAGEQATATLWYDEHDAKASDTVSSLAYCTIDGISTQVNGVQVGGVTGLTHFEDAWYKLTLKNFGEGDDRYCLTPSTGVLPSLATLTIGDLSNNNTVTEQIKTLKVGDAMGYSLYEDVWYTNSTHETKVSPGVMLAIADFTIGGLNDGIGTVKIGDVMGYTFFESEWYTDVEHTNPIAGIMKPFAGMTINEMKVSENVTNAVKTLTVADAMGYTKHDEKWYSTWIDDGNPGNVEVTGMMKALAPKTVGSLNTIGTDTPVGELLGYEKHESVWYEAGQYDAMNPTQGEVKGVIGAICDSYVDNLSTDIKNIELGKTLSLYKYENTENPTDPKNGKWFKDREYTQEATGVMATFADLRIDDLSNEALVTEKSRNVVIGQAMGYTFEGGVWYTTYVGPGDPGNVPVTGLMKTLASKKVGELNDITDTKVGDAMGYTKVDDVWYKTYVGPADPSNVKASGVIQAVADSTIANLETDLNNTKVGKILGYTYNEVEHWWYDGLTKTSTIINTVSDTELNNVGTRLSNLTVADMFSDTERASGFLSLLPPTALLSELGDSTSPNSMSSIFQSTTMGDYVTKGLITFNPSTQAKLTIIDPDWQTRTIQQFIDHLINSVPTMP